MTGGCRLVNCRSVSQHADFIYVYNSISTEYGRIYLEYKTRTVRSGNLDPTTNGARRVQMARWLIESASKATLRGNMSH